MDNAEPIDDPVTRKKIYKLYRDYFDLAEKKRRWNLQRDIPWDQINTEAISPAVRYRSSGRGARARAMISSSRISASGRTSLSEGACFLPVAGSWVLQTSCAVDPFGNDAVTR